MSESENDIVDHLLDLIADLELAEVPEPQKRLYLTPEEWQEFKAHREGLHYAIQYGVESTGEPRPIAGYQVEVTQDAKEKRAEFAAAHA